MTLVRSLPRHAEADAPDTRNATIDAERRVRVYRARLDALRAAKLGLHAINARTLFTDAETLAREVETAPPIPEQPQTPVAAALREARRTIPLGRLSNPEIELRIAKERRKDCPECGCAMTASIGRKNGLYYLRHRCWRCERSRRGRHAS